MGYKKVRVNVASMYLLGIYRTNVFRTNLIDKQILNEEKYIQTNCTHTQ